MKSIRFSIKSKTSGFLLLASMLAALNVPAANVTKLNTTTMINGASDWSAAPATTDVGEFNNVPTLANMAAMTLGGDLTLDGLQLDGNTTGPLTIAAGNTLTLGATGLDMSAANNNMTLNCALTFGSAETWKIASGRTLTINSSPFTAGANLLTITGSGASTINNAGFISSTGGITKNGSGTFTIVGGANQQSIGSSTLTVNGGIANLSNPVTVGIQNMLASTANLSVGGGALTYTYAVNLSQSFNNLTITPGESVLYANRNGSFNTSLFMAGTVTRNIGGTITARTLDTSRGNITFSSLVQTTLVKDANGTPYLTVGNVYSGTQVDNFNDWGALDSTKRAIAAGYTSTTATSVGTSAQNGNVVTLIDTTLAANAVNASFRDNVNESRFVDLNGKTWQTGGILVPQAKATAGSVIKDTVGTGSLTGPANSDLVILISKNITTPVPYTISAKIVDNTSTTITKGAPGTLILSGNNTFTGGLQINDGTVQLGAAGALNSTTLNAVSFNGSGMITGVANTSPGSVASAPTLALAGNSISVKSLSTANNLSGSTPAVQNANGSSVANAVLTVDGSSTATFTGAVQDGTGGGTLSIVKAGSGTQTLGGTLSYSGSTTVSAGTLALAATPSATPSYAVNGTLNVTALASGTLALTSPQTLGGNGTVTGSVSVASGAHTRPGATGVTNTITGNLTYNAGAKADFDLNTSAVSGPNDQVVLNGTSSVLTCGGVAVNINLMGATLDTTTDYVLFKLTGASASISGTFNPVPTWLGTVPASSGGYSIVTDTVNKKVLLHFVNAVAPTVAGTASPSAVVRNQGTFVSVTVTPGSGTVTNVYLDLTLINGTNFVPLALSGTPNVYTNTIIIPAAAVVGSTHIVASAADTTPLTGSGNIALTIFATNEVWNGASLSDANWSDSANWVSVFAPGLVGDAVTFAGGTQPAPNMDNSYSVTGVTFDGTASAFSIGTANSSVLTLTGGVTNNSANAQILNVPITLATTQLINTATGDITFGGAVTGGALTKSGGNTLFLGNSGNTYSGNTTISNGTVSINQSANIGGGQITLAGGTLASGYAAGTRLTLGNNIVVPAGNTGNINMSALNRLNGTVTGGGVVNVTATGGQDDLGGAWNAYSGQVNLLGGGTVRLVINGGTFNGFGAAFVTLTNVFMAVSDNSGGNTFSVGAINVDATATISGPYQGGSPNFVIGGLNQNDVIAGAVQNSTRITKVGSGNLTISSAGTASYTGQTILSNGTLTVVGQINSSALTNYNGATLTGNGTLFSVDLELGSFISPGLGGAGTLAATSDLTFNGGTNVVDISTNSHDLITVAGNLNLVSGGVRLVPGTVLTNGTYQLITYAGTLTGAAGNLSLSGFSQAGQTARLSDTIPNEIDLVVETPSGANLIWAGPSAADNLWNIASSINWSNSAVLDVFHNSDRVTFNNFGAGNTTVDVRAFVSPSSMVVTGAQAYVFQSTTGGGKLSGATNSLVVSGPGSLELDIPSDYGGPTTIGSGSTLTVGNGAISASIGTGLITNNGTLVFNQTNNITLTNILGTGSGTLTKNGAGTLTLTANNTYSWTAIGSGATVQVGTGGATGSLGAGSVTNDGKLVYNKTGTFTVGSINTGPANGGELDFLGAANVTLNNGNTYINNTVVNGGVVKLNANEAIPSAATVPSSTGWLVLDGSATVAGTLDLNGFNQTVNALSGLGSTTNGLITNSAASTVTTNILTVLGSAATTYSGTIVDNPAGSKIGLVVRGANQFELRGANNYSGGTIVGDTATLALHNSGAAGAGGILMSNGTTLRMNAGGGSGDPSVFPGNAVSLVSGATVTFTSQQIANGYGITVAGDATTTAIIGANASDTVSFSSGGLKQFQSMLGTVVIPAASTLRWSANTAANGGDFATWDIEGTMTSKAGAVSLGALTGAGIIDGGGTAGAIAYTVGLQNTPTTFTGTIRDGGAGIISLIKAGTAQLTLSGTITYTGNSTVSSGTLALLEPVSLDNSANINLGGGTLDVSGRGDTTLNLGNTKAQTLAGVGAVTGNLNNQANSTVRGGLGALSVSGTATLAGATILQLNRTNTPATNSQIAAVSFTISGPLTVTNIGPALVGGDTFKLFNHAVSGFSSVTLPTLPGSMLWITNLNVNGSITVTNPVNLSPPPIKTSVNGSILTLSWPTNSGWTLQIQTNSLSTGLNTNWVDYIPGSAGITTTNITLDPAKPTVFFRLKL